METDTKIISYISRGEEIGKSFSIQSVGNIIEIAKMIQLEEHREQK